MLGHCAAQTEVEIATVLVKVKQITFYRKIIMKMSGERRHQLERH